MNIDDIEKMIAGGTATLFFRPEYLDETILVLKAHGFAVDCFDCSLWLTEEKMHENLAQVLGFPDYYGQNLDAFNDCIGELDIVLGRVLVFKNFDSFNRRMEEVAWNLLDIIACESRGRLLLGKRLIALLHSNDPRLEIKPIGAQCVTWNEREWMNKNRGL